MNIEMNLRELLAMTVLHDMSSKPDERVCYNEEDVEAKRYEWRKSDAEFCYDMADHMLMARND